MLEKGKKYLLKEFFNECEVGKTYNIIFNKKYTYTIHKIPILKSNEIYMHPAIYHYGMYKSYFYKATEFIPAFSRFLGEYATEIIGTPKDWYGITKYYELGEIGDADGDFYLKIPQNIVKLLMQKYDIKDIKDFENLIKQQLPNIDHAFDCINYLCIIYKVDQCFHRDGIVCDLFVDRCGREFNLNIIEKNEICKIKVDNKGYACASVSDFKDLDFSATITIIDILD